MMDGLAKLDILCQFFFVWMGHLHTTHTININQLWTKRCCFIFPLQIEVLSLCLTNYIFCNVPKQPGIDKWNHNLNMSNDLFWSSMWLSACAKGRCPLNPAIKQNISQNLLVQPYWYLLQQTKVLQVCIYSVMISSVLFWFFLIN